MYYAYENKKRRPKYQYKKNEAKTMEIKIII
jgi:hypothetical protein